MKAPPNLVGMTVNERLYEAKALDRYDSAYRAKDSGAMIECLEQAWFSHEEARTIVEAVAERDGWPNRNLK